MPYYRISSSVLCWKPCVKLFGKSWHLPSPSAGRAAPEQHPCSGIRDRREDALCVEVWRRLKLNKDVERALAAENSSPFRFSRKGARRIAAKTARAGARRHNPVPIRVFLRPLRQLHPPL